MTCKIWDTSGFQRVVHIPIVLYKMLNKWKHQMQTVWEDILHFIATRLKHVLVETRSFSLEIDKVICIVISPQKKVYILLKCVFLQ